jgi:citrate lyase subunit beta/citryl-CoA lyase
VIARRSCLSVPAIQPRFFEKADRSAADLVFFDLEDSVPPSAKERGRELAVEALRAYEFRDKTRGVRVNACDTRWCFDDLRTVVEGAGDRLDTVVLPKVEGPAEVHFADLLLSQLEAKLGLTHRIGLDLQIESALGLQNVELTAAAAARILALHFGPGDFMATLRVPELTIGRTPAAYPGEFFHYAHFRILVAARARGLQAVDGPYAQVRDLDGLRTSAQKVAALGYDGKWALNPAQAELLNAVFAPSQEVFEKASAIVEAYERATSAGETGAVMLGDEMIDEASRKMAAVIVQRGRAAGMGASERE